VAKNNPSEDEFKPNFGSNEDDEVSDDFGDQEMDLSEAKIPVFQPLTRGIYPAEVIDIEYGLAKTSNKPKLSWRFGVEVEDPDTGKVHVRQIFMDTSLIPEQQGRVKAYIRTVKPDYDLKHFIPRNVGEELKGYPVRLRLDIGKPYGTPPKRRNEVKELLPAEELAGAFLPSGA